MKVEKNQYLEIRFRNGNFFEAYVESWGIKEALVRLPDDKKVIIFSIKDSIDCVKLLDPPEKKEPVKSRISKNEIEAEFESLRDKKKDDLTLKTMAELKDDLNRIEREEFIAKAKSLKPSGMRMVEYGTGIIKVAKSAEHPAQEAGGESSSFHSGLQDMFPTKD